MAERCLQLSPLGRNVWVGDFYNYYTGAIFSSKIAIPEQRIEISYEKQTTSSFFCQQPFELKNQILGINSHDQRYIDEKRREGSSEPWFVHYLNISPEDGNNDEAQVTAFFRVERRTETLKCDAMESQMHDCKLKSGGLATHLVGGVVYGAEVICSFHRSLEGETKERVQRNLYLSAKNYFDQIINQSTSEGIPVELSNVSCTIFSSLDAGKPVKMPFEEFNQYLQEIRSSVGGDHPKNWKPIHLFLFRIPEQFETRIELDRKKDFESEMAKHKSTWASIEEKSLSISKHPCINRFPLLGTVMSDFQQVQADFREKIDKKIEKEEYGKRHTEGALKQMRSISKFLNDVMEWLANRRHEIEEFSRLTSGTELATITLHGIKNQMKKKDTKFFKVFVLNVEYKEDPVMNYMRQEIGDHTWPAELPVVPIFSFQKGSQSVRSKFGPFEKEVHSSNLHGDTSYYILLLLVPSEIDDGTIHIFDNVPSRIPTCKITIESNPNQQDHVENEGSPPESVKQHESSQDDDYVTPSESSSDSGTAEDESETQFPKKARTKPSQGQMLTTTTNIDTIDPTATSPENSLAIKFEELSLNDKKSFAKPTVADKLAKNGSNSTNLERSSTSGESKDDANLVAAALLDKKKTSSQHDHENDAVIHNTNDKRDDEIQESNGDQNSKRPVHETTDISEGRRIADMFVDQNAQYSELIRKGSPDVYMLNASEKSDSVDIKWFDIGRPGHTLQSPDPKNHKIIILMGATGSGKSTLINGMINYILGVEWNDPFRFKCVRNEGNGRNQAHSQTSSVTAYTIHHQEGMAVPYSITIIDTPGYGDTRGIERDKEITAKIHRFLTQQEIPIDEIHAACFVAPSGESRLTYTQRYIIESVLSIFGKDMKENLRLLVTFADNADPPVVEACKLANFPSTLASNEITYSKFNSAVLYCSNVIQENEFSFDELFWDMGQENFGKFFTMLAAMGGQNLTSTREVIQRRQQLGQSLKDIEHELESFLVKIEEIEMHRQQLMTYGHNMETNQNFVTESEEMFAVKVDCDRGLMAYNCISCKKTCEMPAVRRNLYKRACKDVSCRCFESDHQFQPFSWILRPAKVKTTRNDKKTKFELNSNQKSATEDLMANCLDDLEMAKVKVLSLLEHLGANASSLDSTALRSKSLNPAEYLSLMSSRILEEQAPSYEIRLQTLTDLQKSLTSTTDMGGTLKSKSIHPGRNGQDETPSRSSPAFNTMQSGGQVTASTNSRREISYHTRSYTSGTHHPGTVPNASSNTQTYSPSRGRGYETSQTDTAAIVIYGTDITRKHPPGSPEDYYQNSVKTSKKPSSTKDGYCHNPDGSSDSAAGPPSLVQENTDESDETKVILPHNQLADDKDTDSSRDESEQRGGNKITQKKSMWDPLTSAVSKFKPKWM
ncbi:uncharacterized protein LOC130685823 [Daphnia carinata]|uniref:uncharacterized protein LOC130685823 n=1 Tax=Daphnia carinata TaxID=120202 RepID=UPI0025800485|nr:uncharacterized protein LOC130685823 [Daphnia carinata]